MVSIIGLILFTCYIAFFICLCYQWAVATEQKNHSDYADGTDRDDYGEN